MYTDTAECGLISSPLLIADIAGCVHRNGKDSFTIRHWCRAAAWRTARPGSRSGKNCTGIHTKYEIHFIMQAHAYCTVLCVSVYFIKWLRLQWTPGSPHFLWTTRYVCVCKCVSEPLVLLGVRLMTPVSVLFPQTSSEPLLSVSETEPSCKYLLLLWFLIFLSYSY